MPKKNVENLSQSLELNNVDYHTFKEIMRGLAVSYSGIHDSGFFALFSLLTKTAKAVVNNSLIPIVCYGAYEIKNGEVVLAVFEVNFNEEEYTDKEGYPYQLIDVSVSFAEDTEYFRCPKKVRDLLTQTDYVLKAEQAYPPEMESQVKAKMKAIMRRKSRSED